jgi:hypothetical protein
VACEPLRPLAVLAGRGSTTLTPRYDDLLSPLSHAYGSAVRAEVALDWALGRAGLDALPSAPSDLASFLRTHLHAIAETDLGGFIAAALMDELLALVESPETEESRSRPEGHLSARSATAATARLPPPAPVATPQPISQLRLRRAASIMLVRVDPADEAGDLDLNAYTDCVLRVKHPLPACERVRTMRPLVVIVGPAVSQLDVDALVLAAREADCEVVRMGAFVSRAALQDALRRAVARATARRESTDRRQDMLESTSQTRRT